MIIGVFKLILWMQMSTESGQEELIEVKEAYNQLQEEHNQLSISAVHKAKEMHKVRWLCIDS